MAVILPQTLQSDIQGSLPVVPNNGNPAGAYNMPQGEVAAQAAATPGDPYAWLKPSPYMQAVDEILRKQDVDFEQAMFELKNPQSKQLFNLKVNEEGRYDISPLNDYGMTIGANAFDDEPLTYTLPVGLTESPQYVPVLPEE